MSTLKARTLFYLFILLCARHSDHSVWHVVSEKEKVRKGGRKGEREEGRMRKEERANKEQRDRYVHT